MYNKFINLNLFVELDSMTVVTNFPIIVGSRMGGTNNNKNIIEGDFFATQMKQMFTWKFPSMDSLVLGYV